MRGLDKNLHCFGYRKHGDVITFLCEIEHLSFREVLERLDSTAVAEPTASRGATPEIS